MISNKAKYALKAMTILARHHSRQMQAHAIAEEGNIPLKFLETILSDLKNRGLVNSKRGANGGYVLGSDPDDITVGDIMRVIDGPIAPIRCASISGYQLCEDCEDEARCAIRNVMMDARIALSSVLDQRSLKDMAEIGKRRRESIFDDE
ncbi:RrF2 family transcriptional regulator [Sneathiella sp.]|jgi:Rrf2 family protein|uniref:RrF2 family transcriptional regulator n=1 Tax=Sneathiella sp. TaxID=1964365 RepID=UPI002FE19D39